MTRLCKDCKHFTLNTTSWQSPDLQSRYATCARTAVVDGQDGEECKRERIGRALFGKKCGEQGKYWEQKT